MSMIELLIAISMIALMIAVAVPRLNRSDLNMPIAVQDLLGNIRMARASAVSRGVHYRVTLASSYTIQRLKQNDDGTWDPDGSPAQRGDLPHDISITEGEGSVIEFDTRGLLVSQEEDTPPDVITVELHDGQHGGDKTIQIWPSGQVEEA
jgi:Tfp pilus assembly protein FimT